MFWFETSLKFKKIQVGNFGGLSKGWLRNGMCLGGHLSSWLCPTPVWRVLYSQGAHVQDSGL